MVAREKVALAKGAEPSQLKFVYSGKVLQDDKLFQDYKMKDGDSVIYMISTKKNTVLAPLTTSSAEKVSVAAIAETDQQTAAVTAPSATSSTAAASRGNLETLATATAPVSGIETSSEAGRSVGSDFTVGQEREAGVQYMLELGFARSDIEAAMRAAFNNPHRAVEYLLSEIPASARAANSGPRGTNVAGSETTAVTSTAEAHRETAAVLGGLEADTSADIDSSAVASHGNMFDAAAAIDREGGQESELAQLDSDLALLNEAITSNPELLQPLLQRLAATNPHVAQLIAQDPEGFVQRFMDNDFDIDDGEELGVDAQEGTITLELTDLDQNAINRLCELGFERNLVVQVYMACDKNEEVAADILFRDT